MASVRELHEKAMVAVQNAIVEKEAGNITLSKKLYQDAFELEKKAAHKLPKEQKSEPTRSIIFRSAASLAFQAGRFQESTQMIGEALSGYPNKRTFNELNILNEEVKLAIYNEENHYETSPDQFIFHLTGNAVSYGSIYYKEFLDRIDALQKLLRKTGSRLIDIPFSSKKEFLVPSFHSPKSGSFSMKISLTIKHEDSGQTDLVSCPTNVINEFIDCVRLAQENNDTELFERIEQESYLDHFLTQLKKIAPDGDRITSVDFILNDGMVSLKRLSKTIPIGRAIVPDEIGEIVLEDINITGILDYASSRSGGDTIGITDNDNKRYDIKIKEGIEDYVRSYYKKHVCVEGTYDQKWVYPKNITATEI